MKVPLLTGFAFFMIEYIEIEGYKSIKKMKLELRPINILIHDTSATSLLRKECDLSHLKSRFVMSYK